MRHFLFVIMLFLRFSVGGTKTQSMYTIKRKNDNRNFIVSARLHTGEAVDAFSYDDMVGLVRGVFSGTDLSPTTVAYALSLSDFELFRDGTKVECGALSADSGVLDSWAPNNFVSLVNFSPALKAVLTHQKFRTLIDFRGVSRIELMQNYGLNQDQCDELEIRLALYRMQLK